MAIDLRKNTGGLGFHYQLHGSTHGPVPLEQLLEMIEGDTLVWHEGSEWKPAKEQPELKRFFQTKVVQEKVPVERKVVVEKVVEKEVKVPVPMPVPANSRVGGYMGMLLLGLVLGGGAYMAYDRMQRAKDAELVKVQELQAVELDKVQKERALEIAARDSSQGAAISMQAESRLKRMQGLMWTGILAGAPAQLIMDVVSSPLLSGRLYMNGIERPMVGSVIMGQGDLRLEFRGSPEGGSWNSLDVQLGDDMALGGNWHDESGAPQPFSLTPTNGLPDMPQSWWVSVGGFSTEAAALRAASGWATAKTENGETLGFFPEVRSANGMLGALWSFYVVAGIFSTRDSALAYESTLRTPTSLVPTGFPAFSFMASQGRLRNCIVHSSQAYLHITPNATMRSSQYLNSNDQILVDAERGSFFHVVHVQPNTGQRVEGWVLSSDCQCNE